MPPTLEPLEDKMPAKSLQNPLTIDFLKVSTHIHTQKIVANEIPKCSKSEEKKRNRNCR